MWPIIFAILITIFYLIGGQFCKGVRRYGVPGLAVFFGYLNDKKRTIKQKTKYLWIILATFALSLGYGESSWLRKLLGGVDWLTRLVYSLILAGIFSIVNPAHWFIYIAILAFCFQVRAGSLWHFEIINDKQIDILIEDIIRALGIFFCAWLMQI